MNEPFTQNILEKVWVRSESNSKFILLINSYQLTPLKIDISYKRTFTSPPPVNRQIKIINPFFQFNPFLQVNPFFSLILSFRLILSLRIEIQSQKKKYNSSLCYIIFKPPLLTHLVPSLNFYYVYYPPPPPFLFFKPLTSSEDNMLLGF